ncbi:hypothetical protein LB504_009777 [Fusarium proliferatum]|nr:hypothetical protein LB504_009777 [Fusarium proliferatum]
MNYDDYDPVADDLLFRIMVMIAGTGFRNGYGRLLSPGAVSASRAAVELKAYHFRLVAGKLPARDTNIAITMR